VQPLCLRVTRTEMAASHSGETGMKREIEIDAARGLMLVWMTLTHLPTALTPWVNQPFGFISASEGFIFLSALFTGRIYYRLLSRDGPEKMTAKLLSRTLKLYGYHLLLLVFAFGIAARYALGTHGQGLYNLLDFYFAAGPARAVRDALLLVYRPPLLDIIPLYIIFLLLSPVVIFVGVRIGWKFMLGASFAVWLCAQFGLREACYAFLANHSALHIPLNEMGAFNLWAWQFIWVIGMWCGVRWANDDLPVEKWAQRTWMPALTIAVFLFAVRYMQLLAGLDLSRWAPLLDKWHLGLIHLVNFAAVAMVVVRFRWITKAISIRPLVLMGQSSLQVFCTHFIFCFIGIAMMGSGDRIFGWGQAALIAGAFAALLLVARYHVARSTSGRQQTTQKTRPAVRAAVAS
jgi:hypothetical protein